jgi:hypothetical protein
VNVTNRRDEHERDVDEHDVNVKNDDKIDIDVEAERDVERSSTMTTSTFTCDICGKEFNSENSLKFHKIRVHKVGSEKPERGEARVKEVSLPKIQVPKGVEKIATMTLEELAQFNPQVKMHLEQTAELQAENLRLAEELKNVRLKREIENYGYGYDRYGYRRPRYEDDEDDDILRLKKRQLYDEEIKKAQAERRMLEESNQSNQKTDPQVLALLEEIKKRMEKLEDENRELKNENKRLSEELKESERRRQEQRFESLEREIREMKEGQNRLSSQYDVAIKTIDTIKDVLITGMKPVETRPPPKETAKATPTEEELRMLGIPFEEE